MKTELDARRASLNGFEALDPARMGGLSDAQRDAIARAIAARGPALIRQGNTQRLLSKVALGGVVAAAAAFAFMLQSQATKTESPALASVAPSAPSARSCAADAKAAQVTPDEAGGTSIAIGSRIQAVTAQATDFSVVEAEPCVTRLALNAGTLTLKAKDLGGGTLWIDTPHGQFRAAGTFMRIVTLASSTTLRVAEGEVVMTRGVPGAESVGPGQAITIARESVQRFSVSAEDRASLLTAFDSPVETVQEPAPSAKLKPGTLAARMPRPRTTKSGTEAQLAFSATALLTEGEALWRRGNHEAARQAFRGAAQDNGPTGEAAWVRLARLELAAGATDRALMALKARRSRPGNGTLGAEALWLEAQALERAGRGADAVQAAENLLRDYPNSPQAPAAQRLASKKGKVP